MNYVRVVLAVVACALSSLSVRGQQSNPDSRPRLLFDTEVGSSDSLGYKFPSTAFGPAIEIPVRKHLEFQGTAAYSPDKKAITNDGHSFKASGSAIRFINHRFGVIGTLERSWLWTSQFNKSEWHPSAGLVIRNGILGVGRTYLSYVFPTGCVAATQSNPCQIQSNRLQGFELRQDVRATPYMRWGFKTGFYHFCDQGNPNEPLVARHCHWAATGLATMSFELHVGHGAHGSSFDSAKPDTF
jgi:hypothetical protein